jgi:hypothetical protein
VPRFKKPSGMFLVLFGLTVLMGSLSNVQSQTSSQNNHKDEPDEVAATGLIVTFTLMPPSIPAYRVSDGKDMSYPWDIWGFLINGVSVPCEQYTKDTANGLHSFTMFRRDGDFFFVTTKSFGEIKMKIMAEPPMSASEHLRPRPAHYKCEIWATKSKATEILDHLTKKKP